MTIAWMDKETALADLLKSIRGKLKLKQREFAELLNVPESRYKNWEYGAATPPADVVEKAKKLAGSRGVSEVSGTPMVPLKIVGAAAAGPGSQHHPDDDTIYVPESMVRHPSVGWRAEGDSMMPHIRPGDAIVAKAMKTPLVNYIYLIRRADGSVSVKMLKHDGKQWLYVSFNENFPPEPADGELLGLVTGVYRSRADFSKAIDRDSGLMPADFD